MNCKFSSSIGGRVDPPPKFEILEGESRHALSNSSAGSDWIPFREEAKEDREHCGGCE